MTKETKQRINHMITSNILMNSDGEAWWCGKIDDYGMGIISDATGICTNYRVRIYPNSDGRGQIFKVELVAEFV